ncbi:unnamed protein product [Coregonus sp. 'balchen']|nr:unnamed protein product [Coregonus sp. 'balchen']
MKHLCAPILLGGLGPSFPQQNIERQRPQTPYHFYPLPLYPRPPNPPYLDPLPLSSTELTDVFEEEDCIEDEVKLLLAWNLLEGEANNDEEESIALGVEQPSLMETAMRLFGCHGTITSLRIRRPGKEILPSSRGSRCTRKPGGSQDSTEEESEDGIESVCSRKPNCKSRRYPRYSLEDSALYS